MTTFKATWNGGSLLSVCDAHDPSLPKEGLEFPHGVPVPVTEAQARYLRTLDLEIQSEPETTSKGAPSPRKD